MLIVFEGIDGTGKSTQARLLAEAFREKGHEVHLSAEPTTGPHGQRLRRSQQDGRLSPRDELALFLADRRQHVEELIAPALARGAHVILDRYYFSTMAYQGARGLDPTAIRAENEAFAPPPDHLFLLELPVEESLHRISQRNGSGNTFEKRDNLERVAAQYQLLAQRDDLPFLHRLDAQQPPATLQEQIQCFFPELRTP